MNSSYILYRKWKQRNHTNTLDRPKFASVWYANKFVALPYALLIQNIFLLTRDQAAVKAQVEEKQRKKREADEQRRQEEAEQERRIREDRDRLAHNFEREQEKLRKKEEAAAAKHRTMEESMQNAYKEAMMAKYEERIRRLQKQGHDVTNLRKSWDG